MNTEIKVSPTGENVTIRTGAALELKQPNIMVFSGDINSVAEFLAKRTDPESGAATGGGAQAVWPQMAVVIADKDNGTIELQLDPENHFGAKVIGELEESKELDIFLVNKEHEFSREELIKLFRFNRMHFGNADKADSLIKALQKFSASAYVDLVKEDDTRGNLKASVDKKVNAVGIPESFELCIPIYKGQPREKFEVSICLDVIGTRAAFWFESVQLVELLEARKDEIFSKQLESCKQFPIIFK